MFSCGRGTPFQHFFINSNFIPMIKYKKKFIHRTIIFCYKKKIHTECSTRPINITIILHINFYHSINMIKQYVVSLWLWLKIMNKFFLHSLLFVNYIKIYFYLLLLGNQEKKNFHTFPSMFNHLITKLFIKI